MSNPYAEDQVLTAQQAVEAMPCWRLVHGRMHLWAKFVDFRTALEFVTMVGELAEELNHHPDVDIRYKRVHLSISSHDVGGISGRDVALAQAIVPMVKVHNGCVEQNRVCQQSQIAVDVRDRDAVLPFWQALYAYDVVGDELADPLGDGPVIWFQDTDEERPARNRVHIDLYLPAEAAEQRLQAVLAAGGRLVSEAHAPAWWVLADAEGNEACICTWQPKP